MLPYPVRLLPPLIFVVLQWRPRGSWLGFEGNINRHWSWVCEPRQCSQWARDPDRRLRVRLEGRFGNLGDLRLTTSQIEYWDSLILAWMDHGRWVEGGWGLEGIHLWTNTHLESWTRREYKSPSCRLEQFPRLRLVWLRWPGVAARLDDELTCELDSKQQQVGEGEKRTRDDCGRTNIVLVCSDAHRHGRSPSRFSDSLQVNLSELMHQMSVLAVDGVEGGLSLD
ncbi:hypothetical protein K438DRAFT_2070853 [Mycena galopus ATCC 62051]|nr:hypothetical protein K438DRAFT_2070853 [Mycena galopus ATCC 62051]